jgi:hypothetical protein
MRRVLEVAIQISGREWQCDIAGSEVGYPRRYGSETMAMNKLMHY